MTVKRKGRGAFMFEEAMTEGWEVETKEEGKRDSVGRALFWNEF